MQITIRHMQALDTADLDFTGICLLAAPNASGKTSVARYVATAMGGATMPPDLGMPKKDAGALVRHEQAQGGVAVRTGSGTVQITYPEVEKRTEGVAPTASRIAVGTDRLTRIAPKERASVLAGYIKADPIWRDFVAAMQEAGITDPVPPVEENGKPVAGVVERTWKAIEGQGWDVTLKQWQDHASEKKGAWDHTTGETWGSKKAIGWLPKNWDMELGELKREQLELLVTEHQEAVDRALENRGAGAEQSRIAAEKIASRQSIADRLVASQAALAKAEQDLESQRQLRASLPEAEAGNLNCPHCTAAVRLDLVSGMLVKATSKSMTTAELKAARNAIATADGTISRLTSEVTRHGVEIERMEASLAEIDAMVAEGVDTSPPPSDAALTTARAALEHHQGRLAAFDTRQAANRLHLQIVRALTIEKVLAPDGLRQTKLAQMLDAFNDGPLAELCEAAHYVPVTIRRDLSIWSGPHPYALCSKGDQYRVDAILKVACARIDGSGLVICDGADILDERGREGLIGLLMHAEIPALICMTFDRPKDVPDLKSFGIGESYWLSDARSMPLAEALAS